MEMSVDLFSISCSFLLNISRAIKRAIVLINKYWYRLVENISACNEFRKIMKVNSNYESQKIFKKSYGFSKFISIMTLHNTYNNFLSLYT